MIGGGNNIRIHLHGSGRAANPRMRILTRDAVGVKKDAQSFSLR